MPDNYILYALLAVSVLVNLVLFVSYRIWKHRAKKTIRGKLYLQGDEIWSEFNVTSNDLRQMDVITLKIIAADNRKE